jgi:hypothetical protein
MRYDSHGRRAMTDRTANRINRLAERLAKTSPPSKRVEKKHASIYVRHSNALDADTSVGLGKARSLT